MTFNKWFPDRPHVAQKGLTPERRALVLRGAWYVSLAMLVAGYVLMAVFWN